MVKKHREKHLLCGELSPGITARFKTLNYYVRHVTPNITKPRVYLSIIKHNMKAKEKLGDK